MYVLSIIADLSERACDPVSWDVATAATRLSTWNSDMPPETAWGSRVARQRVELGVPEIVSRTWEFEAQLGSGGLGEAVVSYRPQRLAIASSASQMCRPPLTLSCPSLVVSTDFGAAARLSKVATLSWSIPSSAPTEMHVVMLRIVLVTGFVEQGLNGRSPWGRGPLVAWVKSCTRPSHTRVEPPQNRSKQKTRARRFQPGGPAPTPV